MSISRELKSEDIKQLVKFRQCTNTAFEGNAIFAFSVLPGSAEAQVI